MKIKFLILILLFMQAISVLPQKPIPEKVFACTDRNTYIAGETILYQLNIIDTSSGKTGNLSSTGYVVLRSQESGAVAEQRLRFTDRMAFGKINLPDTLRTGLYELTAYTNFQRNFGEKSFFRKQILIVQQSTANQYVLNVPNSVVPDSAASIHPALSTDSVIFKQRASVHLKIAPVPAGGIVSVSVFEDINNGHFPTLSSTMGDSFVSDKNIDSETPFLAERKGKILEGKVIDEKNNPVPEGAIVLLSRRDTVPNLEYAVTDANGSFRFLLDDYYEGKELFLSIKNATDTTRWVIKTDDKFAPDLTEALVQKALKNNELIKKSQNIVYINSSYGLQNDPLTSRTEANKSIANKHRFFNCPVNTLRPADYVSLNDFPEIITELFPLIRNSGNKERYEIKVVGATTDFYGYSGPAVFLDGVYVDNLNKIKKLGSDKIEKIDVIYNERTFGDLIFQGMVSIKSRGTLVTGKNTDFNSVTIQNDSLSNIQPDILSCKIPGENSTYPFVNQLLYWRPNMVLTDKNETELEFNTTDNTGNYTIKLEGITANGERIFSTQHFTVIRQ